MSTTTETWQHREITTNGIRMHYVTQGSGSLVVLLHGFPEFWYSWRYQIPFLAEHGYTVVAPDLRGYNDTDKPRTGYDVATLTRDIAGLVKGLGQEFELLPSTFPSPTSLLQGSKGQGDRTHLTHLGRAR
jgi:pimeloyl-ACP methyl ester carboxylesterase